MALIQSTIFLFCIGTIYAASITNISQEEISTEIEDTPINEYSYDSNVQKNEGDMTEYDPISPSFIVSDNSNAFQVGKSLIETLMGMFKIVRQMDLSQEGLKSVSFLVARMLSLFAGQYYETLKKLMPVFSGMAMAILETLR